MPSLIQEVNARMERFDIGQETLAKHCGLSQGHLSKVLSGELEPKRKTRQALEAWLEAETNPAADEEKAAVTALVNRLLRSPAKKRNEVLQLLKSVDRLLR